jgi:hypothetical protein
MMLSGFTRNFFNTGHYKTVDDRRINNVPFVTVMNGTVFDEYGNRRAADIVTAGRVRAAPATGCRLTAGWRNSNEDCNHRRGPNVRNARVFFPNQTATLMTGAVSFSRTEQGKFYE